MDFITLLEEIDKIRGSGLPELVLELWMDLTYCSVVLHVHQQGETLTYSPPTWLPPSSHLILVLSICNT